VLEGKLRKRCNGSFRQAAGAADLADNIKCGNSLIGPEFLPGPAADLFGRR